MHIAASVVPIAMVLVGLMKAGAMLADIIAAYPNLVWRIRYAWKQISHMRVPRPLQALWSFPSISFLIAASSLAVPPSSPLGALAIATAIGIHCVAVAHRLVDLMTEGRVDNFLASARPFASGPVSVNEVRRAAAVLGIVSVLGLVATFGIATYWLMRQDAAAYRRLDGIPIWVQAAYFVVTTTTTVGYGDISPTSTTAMLICMLDQVLSFLTVTLGLAYGLSVDPSSRIANGDGE